MKKKKSVKDKLGQDVYIDDFVVYSTSAVDHSIGKVCGFTRTNNIRVKTTFSQVKPKAVFKLFRRFPSSSSTSSSSICTFASFKISFTKIIPTDKILQYYDSL